MSESTQLIIVNETVQRMFVEIARDPHLKSENTRRGYKHDLQQFESWRDNRPMTKLLVEEYAALLQSKGKSPNTINRILSAVRWWARRVIDIAHESPMTIEQREEVIRHAARVASVEDTSGTREAKGRMIEPGELSALMRTCRKDSSPAGVRDSAIIALAWATGARRSEIAGLQVSDIQWTSEDEADIVIRGKGDKTRKEYLYNGAALALRDWLSLRGTADGALFFAIDKAGHIISEPRVYGLKDGSTKLVEPGVSDEALAQMLDKRAEQAEVSNITWHDFRRSFASTLLDSNVDLVTVQKLMGHSSPVTTSNYDRRDEETKKRAIRALHVPYKPIER